MLKEAQSSEKCPKSPFQPTLGMLSIPRLSAPGPGSGEALFLVPPSPLWTFLKSAPHFGFGVPPHTLMVPPKIGRGQFRVFQVGGGEAFPPRPPTKWGVRGGAQWHPKPQSGGHFSKKSKRASPLPGLKYTPGGGGEIRRKFIRGGQKILKISGTLEFFL